MIGDQNQREIYNNNQLIKNGNPDLRREEKEIGVGGGKRKDEGGKIEEEGGRRKDGGRMEEEGGGGRRNEVGKKEEEGGIKEAGRERKEDEEIERSDNGFTKKIKKQKKSLKQFLKMKRVILLKKRYVSNIFE